MKEEVYRMIMQKKFAENMADMREELMIAAKTQSIHKDIIIVVKDQLEYMQNCIKSIYENTKDFTLYIWDNSSREDTKQYLKNLETTHDNIILHRNEVNLGFLQPNNEMAARTTAPYIILLNSDTEVKKGWDKALIGWLQNNPECLEVGYAGSRLNEEFKGGPAHFGYEIDYLPGWGVCISRETYNQFGLFDGEHLSLAYCEDADLSLRIKEAGFKIYALYVDLVFHFENKTVVEVNKDQEARKVFSEAFEKNHAYMRERWAGKGLTHIENGESEQNGNPVSASQMAANRV